MAVPTPRPALAFVFRGVVVLAWAAALGAVGCVNGPAPKGMPIVYSEADIPSTPQRLLKGELRRVQVGMSQQEFEAALPAVYPIGAHDDITAWEYTAKYEYIDARDITRPVDFRAGVWHPAPRVMELPLWFYFRESHLVSWGRPNDWPTRPDIIIEHRER